MKPYDSFAFHCAMEKPRRVGGIYDIFITEDMRFGFWQGNRTLLVQNSGESVNKQSVPPSFLVRWNVREAVPAPMDDDPHTLIGLQADPYLLHLSKY
jgi:hypothetical protein